jgi:hypothetical protein
VPQHQPQQHVLLTRHPTGVSATTAIDRSRRVAGIELTDVLARLANGNH